MGGDNAKFMALVEFICFLNPLKSTAQSPKTLKALVSVVIVRGKIVLKRKHGINGIKMISQRPKQSVDDNSLPGLISQGFSV